MPTAFESFVNALSHLQRGQHRDFPSANATSSSTTVAHYLVVRVLEHHADMFSGYSEVHLPFRTSVSYSINIDFAARRQQDRVKMRWQSVDFPQPLCPSTATNAPCSIGQVHAVKDISVRCPSFRNGTYRCSDLYLDRTLVMCFSLCAIWRSRRSGRCKPRRRRTGKP